MYAELWVAGASGENLQTLPDGRDDESAVVSPPISSLIRDATTKIIVNNGNDALGYIIPATQFDAHEPFAYEPEGQYGEEVSIGPHAGPEIADAYVDLAALSPH